MAFSKLDLSNISPEGDVEPSTTRGRSRGVEIREYDPASEEVHEEAPNETSETRAGRD